MSKPCDKCPWIQPGRPDLEPKHIEAARAGQWFCCHVNMGTCYGALAEHKRAQRADA